MESMDNVREHIEALEQQMKVMGTHAHMVERRLRWWRGMASGVFMLGLLSWALPSGKALRSANLPKTCKAGHRHNTIASET